MSETASDTPLDGVLRPGMSVKAQLSEVEASNVVSRLYGLNVVSIKRLDGYDDCNFRIQVAEEHNNRHIGVIWPHGYTLKIINWLETAIPGYIDDINKAIQHLGHHGVCVPSIVHNLHGKTWSLESFKTPHGAGSETKKYAVRLLTFLPGVVLARMPVDGKLLFRVGVMLAQINTSLQSFTSDVLQRRRSMWCLYRVPELRQFVFCLQDDKRRRLVEDVIACFENQVLGQEDKLFKGFVHGDYNENNILVLPRTEQDSVGCQISGVLDFSDVCYSPLIFDVAIMMAYSMFVCQTIDPLVAPAHCLAGYLSHRSLSTMETDLLQVSMAARLCQSLVLGAYTHSQDPGNEYVLQSSRMGWELLKRLWTTPADELRRLWQDVLDSQQVAVSLLKS